MRFLSFLSITILLLGCKYSCDGNFKDFYSSYNFYEINDSLKFYSHADTIKFEVIESEYDEPSSFRGIAMDVDCVYQSFFKTNKIQNDYQLNIEYGGGVTHIKITEHDEFDLLKYKRNIIANELITFEYNSVYFQDSIQHLEVFLL